MRFFEALSRAGAGEKYFESRAAFFFVIVPLLRTVKRISEVTYLQQIIIDNVKVNIVNSIVTFIAIDNVVNTAHFENFLQR